MSVKSITDGELSHILNVIQHCEDEFRALEDDGCFCDTDGTYELLQEARNIVQPLLEKKEYVE